MDKASIPQPIYDAQPDVIELYWLAWQQAHDHITYRDNFPQSPYMDEGCRDMPNSIWIWDTCFMALFCKYAPDQFPGIQSLDNFYHIIHDRQNADITIHHPDNPPLFAWAEYQYLMLTGDLQRVHWLLVENQYLQRHYDFIESMPADHRLPIKHYDKDYYPNTLVPHGPGYHWHGLANGMDNTPRGRDNYPDILWLDILAQQALSAYYIAQLAQLIDQPRIAQKFQQHYEEKTALLNRYYWDQTDSFYYDITAQPPHNHVKVKTPASYWPLLCHAADPHQAQAMLNHALNDSIFGKTIPWPSVSRDDPAFDPQGCYWRGSIWLPTAYMASKALQNYRHFLPVAQMSANLLRHMYQTYRDVEPHTIWEAYNPQRPLPAINSKNKIVRQDFCGWSALGPIALFIESILGFHTINALTRQVHWHKHLQTRHGIKRLRFADITTDIIAENNTVAVTADKPYTLIINNQNYTINPGSQQLTIPKEQ